MEAGLTVILEFPAKAYFDEVELSCGCVAPSPRLRGEGRGEGALRLPEPVESPPHPDLLPAGGEKEKQAAAQTSTKRALIFPLAMPGRPSREVLLDTVATAPVNGGHFAIRLCACVRSRQGP